MSESAHNLRVALVWNGTVFFEKTFTQMSEPVVTVGDNESNLFIVPAPGLPEAFEMFERTENGYNFRFSDKIDGSFNIEDEDFDVEELIDEGASKKDSASTEEGKATIYEREVLAGDWGLVDLGNVQIFFQVNDKAEVAPGRGLLGGFEGVLMGTLTLSAILHIVFLIVAHLGFSIDPQLEEMQNLDRFVQFMAEDVEDPPEEEEMEEPEDDTTGKKAGGEEGKFGKEDAEVEESKIPKVDGEMVKEIDVNNLGVNKVLNSDVIGQGPLNDIFNSDEGELSNKMNIAMSGEGGDLQVGRGAGGMGLRGTGKGGGGEGFGRIGGLGKVDTGGGKGTGAKLGKKKARKVKTKFTRGTPKIGDFCDKGNIRRVVGAKSRAIKYCYEKELQTSPDIKGKIQASWKIMLDGKVQDASIASSTMGSPKVEGCITRVIKRMRFEPPKGGICIIQYPFVFSGM